jgi:hypothetical protein
MTSKAELRLDLLRAQLLTETGRAKEADLLLTRLNDQYPDSPEVLGSLASLESSLQQTRKATEHYRQALRHQPENQELRDALEILESRGRPRFGFHIESKTVTKAQQERILGFDTQMKLSQHATLGVEMTTNQMEVDSVRYEDGRVGPFSGQRQRAEFFLRYLPGFGGSLTTSFLTNGTGLGGALHFQYPDYSSLTEFVLDYKRPNWDFVEGIANQTTRDRIQVRRFHQIGDKFSIVGSVSGNRYRTSMFDSAATSAGFEAVGRYQLPQFPVTVEAGIESEYRISAVSIIDDLGTPFSPVPLISREIHFADLSFWKRWNSTCWTDGFAGYSVDRLGGSGPFAGVNLKCEPRRGFGGTIWFDQRLHTVDTSQIVLRLGGTLFWRF